jgi:hypothetical protein
MDDIHGEFIENFMGNLIKICPVVRTLSQIDPQYIQFYLGS